MQASVEDLVKTEKEAVTAFEGLTAAKAKEIEVLSASIESKTGRVGELGVEIATLKNDNEDTMENLEADQKFAADLKKNCGKAGGAFEEDMKLRGEEVVAIADTIKVLNNDDALDLFKKTLPSASASFLQVQESSSSRRAQAAQVLSKAPRNPRLDFILLALKGKKAGFGKVLKMVDGLVATLTTEQGDDDAKKEYCSAQFDKSEDTITGLKNKISDKEAEVGDSTEGQAKLVEEIAALKAGIVALDNALVEATANRKEESANHKELVTGNSAAKELLLFAKNRLNKFYNPKLYKAPPAAEAFLQLSQEEAPPPPPATAEAYKAKSGESGGVIAMIDLLVKDLDKEIQVSNVEEANSAEEYEQTVADSAGKRRGDAKALVDKEAAKGNLDAFLEEAAADLKGLNREVAGADKYLVSLHGECDWLVKYHEARKQARTDEIESLNQAKAVLSGADYSFVQRSSTARARKFLRSA